MYTLYDLILTMEVGETLEPGAVLLPRVPDKCLADPLQDLLPVQNHLDHLVTLTLNSEPVTLTDNVTRGRHGVLTKLTGELINKLQT